MVDQISGSSSLALRPIEPQRLTGSQRSSVQDILADFDAEEVSEADAVAIREKFRAEGIRPSADLRSEIEAAGFDVDDLRPPGGPGGAGGPGGGHHGPPPPPPPDEARCWARLGRGACSVEATCGTSSCTSATSTGASSNSGGGGGGSGGVSGIAI